MESWHVAFLIILGYLIFMIAVGIAVYRRSRKKKEDAREFFLMGKNIGPFLLFWTTLATL